VFILRTKANNRILWTGVRKTTICGEISGSGKVFIVTFFPAPEQAESARFTLLVVSWLMPPGGEIAASEP
jgi:hypothetical protein